MSACSASGRAERRLPGALLALAVALGPGASRVPADEAPAAIRDADVIQLEIGKLELALSDPGADRVKLLGQLARALRESEDPKQVARGLRIQLDLEPGNLEVKRELAAAAAEMGRVPVARKLIDEVLRARPGDPEALLVLGQIHDAADLDQEALTAYEGVLVRQPDRLEALLGAANAAMSLDRPRLALERATRALALDPKNVEAAGIKAAAAKEIEEGKVDVEPAEPGPRQRLAALRARREAAPTDPVAVRALARGLLDAGYAGEAREELLALLRKGGADLELLLALAEAHRLSGDPSGARVYAEKGVAAAAAMPAPRRALAELELAEAFANLGQVAHARKTLDRAATSDPKSARIALVRGLFELEQGALAAAEAWLTKARVLEPEDATIRVGLARILFAQGKLAEAGRELAEARREDRREPSAFKLAAELATRRGAFRDAEQAWKEYLLADPLDLGAWVALAELQAQEDPARAAVSLETAWALDRDDPVVAERLEAVLARLPETPERADLRLALTESMGIGALEAGRTDEGIRLIEGLAEARGRAMRRLAAEASDPAVKGDAGRRKAVLRRLLAETRAKIRAHRTLAEAYLDLERDQDAERQWNELHHLDPADAEYIRQLALYHYEKGRLRTSLGWFRKLPASTRLGMEEKLAKVDLLERTGREQQAERAWRELDATEPPDDEVKAALADHQGRKGDERGAEIHARRAVTQFSAAQPSLDLLRLKGKAETPDYWVEAFHFTDTDGIDVFQAVTGRRFAVSERTMVALAISQFEVDDRFTPPLDDYQAQVLVRSDVSEKLRLSSILGLTRFSTDNGLAFDLQGDYHADDEWSFRLRLFRDSVNETPLAATRAFQQTGFELTTEWFASHRWRFLGRYDQANITGGNRRTSWTVDAAWRPVGPAFPGWFHYAVGALDYRRRVAPALYFAPDDQDRTDAWYEISESFGGLQLSAAYGLLRDIGFGLTHHFDLSATVDQGRWGQLVVDWTRLDRTRSYHDFAQGFRSDELTVAWNGQF